MDSVFLQREAEIGNKDVIFTLKDDKYPQENHLAVDPNWKNIGKILITIIYTHFV